MLSNVMNKNNINISAKKTRPTQENEENSNSGKDNQLFDIKPTERIVIQHKGKERRDRYGNLITKKGKQKVTFIDKVENKKFEVIVNIESFKEFNKTEEFRSKHVNNGCCYIVWL